MGKEPVNLEKQRAAMEAEGDKGWAAFQKGDYKKAVEFYDKAVDLAKQVSDHGALAVFSSYQGISLGGLGEREKAVAAFKAAIETAHQYGLSKVEAHASLLLAEQYRDDGHADDAIACFLRALDAAYSCEDRNGMEIAFGNLGRLYLEKGWAEQSIEWFRHALEVREDTPNKAAWLGSLGLAYTELGLYDDANDYFTRAFNEAGLNDDRRTQAICRGSQGNALFEAKRYEEAATCYEEALTLSEKAEDQRRVGIWLGNIGNAWLKRGDLNKAVEHCQRAVDLAKAQEDLQSQAAHMDSLGDCYFAQGNLNLALERYQEALSLSREIEDRQGQRIYLSNLGKTYQQMGQLQPAFDFFSSAIELFDEQRSAIKADDLKTSFQNRGQDMYRDMVKVCLSMGKRVEALEYVGRAKSRALLDLLSNSPIDVSQLDNSGDESLQKLIHHESELRNQIAHFERLFWQGSSGGGGESGTRGAAIPAEDSQRIYAEWRDVVNQLRRRHPNYASLVCASTLTFAEISELWNEKRTVDGTSPSDNVQGDFLLNRNTAIVEFYWTDQYLLSASLWHGASQPALNLITDADKLTALEEDLANFLEMSATEGWEVPVSLCKRLYAGLFGAVLSELPEHINHLLLVPHGSLFHLPFSALHDGSGYVCQKFATSYLPTTSLIPVLAKEKAEAQASEKQTPADDTSAPYLVSAISDYSITRKEGVIFSSRLRSAAGLDDLTYTLEEAQTIFDLGKSTSIRSKMLTNQEVKESLPELFSKYPVVHFAGHAVFNPDEPLASGLVLADGSILTAAAILQGNLLRTHCGKLLVLSACQTGVNKVTAGGEILGLARALMYAGMPNLVLSLWEVADRSTATLMKDFHSAWQGGKIPIYEALRQAQIQALENGHPIHAWAPFVHMGIDQKLYPRRIQL
ncbi:MAG TPA: CHAT domain-containing tetratricopeptide repeat protein [Candidatus Melainabacteria bacterium]|nr:CHAT domain-containing tetratricopeptide repeat protein [Candidatus Melainabacteria bacterium]